MISAIIARLGLDSGDFKKGLNESKALAKDAGRDIADAIAVPLSVGALIGAGKAIIDFAGNLRDAADSVGVNAEAMQELHHAFGLSGTSAEQVDKALVKLQQSTQDARDGNEKAIASFEKLGVTWDDLNRLTPDELLMKIADGMRDAKDPTAALSAVMDVLGKSGARMAAGLKQGSGAIRELREEASKLSEEEINSLDNAGDALSRLSNDIKVVGARTLNAFADPSAKGGFVEQVNHMLARLGIGKEKQITGAAPTADEIAAARAGLKARPATPEDPRKKKEREAEEKAAETARRKALDLDEKLANAKRRELQKEIEAGNRLYLKKLEERKRAEEKAAADRKRLLEQGFAELHRQLEEAEAARAKAREAARDQFVEDKLDPDAARDRKRRSRKEANLRARAIREEQLAERDGKAKVDFERDRRLKSGRGLRDLLPAAEERQNLKDALDGSTVLKQIATNTAKLGVNL